MLTSITMAAAIVAAVAAQDTSPSGPTMTGTAPNCVAWYTVKSGDSCPSVEQQFNITPDQFFSWNPAVSRDCSTNFWVGESYCVGVGNAPNPTPTTTTVAGETSPSGPTMTGTAPNCNSWYTVKSGDSCPSVEQKFNITPDQFFAWNPAVSRDCSTNFWVGESYCVGVGDLKSTTSPTTVAGETSPSGPTMTGTAPNCNSWYTVKSGDSCPSIEQKFNITPDQFFAWNPAVSRDCSTNFWVGESYCVGVGDPKSTMSPTTTPTSSSVNTSSTPYSTRFPITSRNITTPTSPTAWPPTKTQPGEPSGCSDWHFVVPSDTCQRIVNRYGNTLTMEQFLAWNPALKKDCSGLFIGFYVCVAVKPTTMSSFDWFSSPNTIIPSATSWNPPVTPTINSTFTASPQRSGTPANCQSFYKAMSGNTCNDVLKAYPYITKELFFQWNPALNGDCNGLWENYWYCVANYKQTDLPQPPSQDKPGTPTGDGTISGCKSWYKTTGGDTCDVIVQAFGSFSTSDFVSWNPSVGSTCSDIKDGIYYCVGVASTPTTRTSSLPTTTTTDSMPTQSGVASNCNKYWLVNNSDDCRRVVSASNISMEDFIKWNPAVSSAGSCKLTPQVNVCVGVKSA